MKVFILCLFCCLFCASFSYSQYYSDFEDGTLQAWTNSDTSTVELTVEETGIPSDELMLQKSCDGSDSAIGRMAIINTSPDWTGNYPSGYLDAFAGLGLHVKNENDFDLHFRLGYMGGVDNTKMVLTESIVVPAFSDWGFIEFEVFLPFTIISGESTRDEVFADSHEVKIFHNDALSYDGKQVNGTLQIGLMLSSFLLSTNDQVQQKTVLFPNPVKNIFTVSFPQNESGSIAIYNVLGQESFRSIFSGKQTQFDIANLKSGIYLASIITETATITKKLVKQ